MVTLFNRLSQVLTITIRNPDTGAYYDAKIPPNGRYGPLDRTTLSPYTEQLVRRGHLVVRGA